MSAGINPCRAPRSLESPGHCRGGSRPGLGGPWVQTPVENPAQRGSEGKGQPITIAPESLSCRFKDAWPGGERGCPATQRDSGWPQPWHSSHGHGDT